MLQRECVTGILRRRLAALGIACTVSYLGGVASAQEIYPVHRAEILAGSRFDFKVEFPSKPTEADISVTINGRRPTDVFGKETSFVVNEDNWGHSALWLRDADLPQVGLYVVEARSGGATVSATWEEFSTKPRAAKNVILFIGDGMSVAHRTAARMLSKGIENGRYGGQLAMDDMPAMALVSTSGIESIVTDSANSMSAYTTGHKTCGGAMGVYCAANKSAFDHPRVEALASLARRRHGMAIGIVTTTEVIDATPAAMAAHTVSRTARNEIANILFDAAPDVLMGGGRAFFQPKSVAGSKRVDESDLVGKFRERGYKYATTAHELRASASDTTSDRILGLFHPSHLDGAFDRRVSKRGTVPTYPDQPDLTDMVRVAIDHLARKPEGFFLMVESGRIDHFSHQGNRI